MYQNKDAEEPKPSEKRVLRWPSWISHDLTTNGQANRPFPYFWGSIFTKERFNE